jgi:hypothetical protein
MHKVRFPFFVSRFLPWNRVIPWVYEEIIAFATE